MHMIILDVLFVCLLTWCAISDWRKREISNGALMGILALSSIKLGYDIAFGEDLVEYLPAVPLFVLLYTYWKKGSIGGGDVKFIPLLCLYMGITTMSIAFAICLLFLSIMGFALHLYRGRALRTKVPLAPPLCISCILAILMTNII